MALSDSNGLVAAPTVLVAIMRYHAAVSKLR
jgi:hypothetical protein